VISHFNDTWCGSTDRKGIVHFFIALAVVTASCPTIVTAEAPGATASWPQFRGPDRTGVSSSSGLLRSWPDDGPPLIWKAEGAGRGYASVSISEGKLFTMGDAPSTADDEDEDEYLLCFDQRSGKQIWKARLGEAWSKGAPDWQSSRSTPTIDGNRAYSLTAYGDLVCSSTDDGAELWRKNLREDFEGKKGDGWGYSESVLIDGDRLICTPGGEKNTMVALNKDDGELIWSASREGDRGAGHASIVISEVGTTRVYVQTTASGALGVRASDGNLMWSYEIDETTAVIPTPIVRDDLVFFTAGYGCGGALLRQVSTKDQSVEVEEVYPPNKKLQNKHGGVVLVDGQLYGDTDASGTPFCADLMTGELHWKKRGSGRGSASVVAAEGHLYIWFSNAVLAMAKASLDGYEEVGRLEIETDNDRPSWAHPVIAGDKLYLRMDDQILCYDLSSQGG